MKIIARLRRRRSLQRIRANMAALGHDPGDLKSARNYRRFLKGLKRVTVASQAASLSMAEMATAIRRVRFAMLFLPLKMRGLSPPTPRR